MTILKKVCDILDVVNAFYPKSLLAASAMPTKLPGITPSKNTKRQQIPRAIRRGMEDGTFSSDAGVPVHITLTTLR